MAITITDAGDRVVTQVVSDESGVGLAPKRVVTPTNMIHKS